MNSGVYDGFKEGCLSDTLEVDFTNTIMVALMGRHHSFHYTSDRMWQDVRRHEIVGGDGYEAGGKPLENLIITRVGDRVMIDADDTVWHNASFGFYHMVLYFKETSGLICDFYRLGGEKGAGFDVIIQWNKLGIISEYNPDDPPQYFTRYINK